VYQHLLDPKLKVFWNYKIKYKFQLRHSNISGGILDLVTAQLKKSFLQLLGHKRLKTSNNGHHSRQQLRFAVHSISLPQ
jgi:hypothetical protein